MRSHHIGLLALFVALGGTSFAAASYINGSKIKPHSIPKNRLTNSAISALHGAKGSQGSRGTTGARGSTGPKGTTGLVGSLDQLAGLPCSTNVINNRGLIAEVKTGATVVNSSYDGSISGLGIVDLRCVIGDKYEPNDTRGAKATLASQDAHATVFPAGNEDWFAFPPVSYEHGINVELYDTSIHPPLMDVYVDGGLAATNTRCFFQASTLSHTVEVRVFDSNATSYAVATGDASASPCS